MERKYQQLKVWQEAMDLAERIYAETSESFDSDRFGLPSQLRRSAVSIASNIAEGSGRGSDKDFLRFLYIARGSLQELETQILLSERLQQIKTWQPILEDINRVFALLGALINRLKHNLLNQNVRPQTSVVRPT